LLKGLKI